MPRISKAAPPVRRHGSDWKKVDAHIASDEDYADAPELTDDMLKASRPTADVMAEVSRRVGRPKSDNPKQQITMRLDRDVIDRLRATGTGWQVRVNQALRDFLEKNAG
jgi:uncharacterized protein (DUF4415 family)